MASLAIALGNEGLETEIGLAGTRTQNQRHKRAIVTICKRLVITYECLIFCGLLVDSLPALSVNLIWATGMGWTQRQPFNDGLFGPALIPIEDKWKEEPPAQPVAAG
jgi:hypothetical protein